MIIEENNNHISNEDITEVLNQQIPREHYQTKRKYCVPKEEVQTLLKLRGRISSVTEEGDEVYIETEE